MNESKGKNSAKHTLIDIFLQIALSNGIAHWHIIFKFNKPETETDR